MYDMLVTVPPWKIGEDSQGDREVVFRRIYTVGICRYSSGVQKQDIPSRGYPLIWYSTSILGSWNCHWLWYFNSVLWKMNHRNTMVLPMKKMWLSIAFCMFTNGYPRYPGIWDGSTIFWGENSTSSEIACTGGLSKFSMENCHSPWKPQENL